MKGIIITAQDVVRLVDIPENGKPLYKTIRAAVGGFMENTYPRRLPKGYVMIVNEEGKLLGLPINNIGSYLYESDKHGDVIVGDVIILKLGTYKGETDVVGIPDEEAATTMNELIKIIFKKEENEK